MTALLAASGVNAITTSVDATGCGAVAFGAAAAVTALLAASGAGAITAPGDATGCCGAVAFGAAAGVVATTAPVGSTGIAAACFGTGAAITAGSVLPVVVPTAIVDSTSESVAKDIWVLGRRMAAKKALIPAEVTGVKVMDSSGSLALFCATLAREASRTGDATGIGLATRAVGTDPTGLGVMISSSGAGARGTGLATIAVGTDPMGLGVISSSGAGATSTGLATGTNPTAANVVLSTQPVAGAAASSVPPVGVKVSWKGDPGSYSRESVSSGSSTAVSIVPGAEAW